jgi:hypothetical protein
MKKLVLIPILMSGLLFAEGVLKPTQMKTMQSLEAAMATVQKGFLYNNENVVESGITDLKKNLEDVNSFIIKNEKDKTFNAAAYAATETSAIAKLADEIEKAYKDGKKEEALAAYAKTLSRCVVCHKIIRKW